MGCKFRLVQLVDGEWITNDFTEDNVVPAMEIRGFTLTGMETRRGLRPELQGQPKFGGVLGPMWGGVENGEPVVRYECQSAYDKLST